jgi:cytochrome c oxidase subunit IV
MGNAHNLAIFRGTLKFKSNQSKIWGIFIFLSIVTIIEVALGIIKPEFLLNKIAGTSYLNIIFLVLTIVKAYYITWDFMHMRDETSTLRRAVVWTFVFLALYLAVLLLIEADFVYMMLDNQSMKWNF